MIDRLETTPFAKALLENPRTSGAWSEELEQRIAISGPDFAKLMRKHKQTFDDLKANHGIPKKQTRRARKHGLSGFAAVNFVWCITGVWIA